MANALFRLGLLLGKREYLETASSMVEQMSARIGKYPGGFAGWYKLLLKQQQPHYEIAVVGPDAAKVLTQIQSQYLPQAVVAATSKESNLHLFKGRYTKDKTHIFVCRDNVCQLPVEDLKDAKAIYNHQ